jgi:hypothetical protein
MNETKGRDLFGAGIRVIGLLSFGRGFFDLLYILLFLLGLTNSSVTANFPSVSLADGLFYFLSGIYLLRGAPILVNFAYPKSLKESEIEEDLSTSQD